MDRGWTQFLLVAIPVLSLVGGWLALKTIDDTGRGRTENGSKDKAKGE